MAAPYYPGSIVHIRSTGTGVMGALFGGAARNTPTWQNGFRLGFIRGHFARVAGAGTNLADLTLQLLSAAGAAYDAILFTKQLVGVGVDVNLRIAADEAGHWEFRNNDLLQINWPNPDVAEIEWGLTVGLELLADAA